MTDLTDAQKRALDGLEAVRRSYYKCFSDRRDFEWKLSMAIWTSMTIYLSALVVGKGSMTVEPRLLIWGTFSSALFLTLIHAVWLFGTGKANALDKSQAFEAADAMREVLHLRWSPKLQARVDRKRDSGSFGWSQLSQLLITALLGLLAVLACAAA